MQLKEGVFRGMFRAVGTRSSSNARSAAASEQQGATVAALKAAALSLGAMVACGGCAVFDFKEPQATLIADAGTESAANVPVSSMSTDAVAPQSRGATSEATDAGAAEESTRGVKLGSDDADVVDEVSGSSEQRDAEAVQESEPQGEPEETAPSGWELPSSQETVDATDAGATPATEETSVDGGATLDPVVDMAVHGHVIDFWDAPLPGLEVTLADATVVTDERGEFIFDAAPAQYDVSFVVATSNGSEGWRYEGLTRRDPTLQVSPGRPKRTSAIEISPVDVEFTTGTLLGVSFGGPDGAISKVITAKPTTLIPTWYGPESTLANYHTLLWQVTDGLPTSYLGYDTGVVGFSTQSTDGELQMDAFATTNLDTDNISGSVSSVTGQSRSNMVFVRFEDGASLGVLVDRAPADDFSYLVPSLPQATVAVAAFEGWFADEAYALAYQSEITPGTASVSLDIPKPPEPVGPTSVSIGAADVAFDWQGEDAAVVIHIERLDVDERFNIVTTKTAVPFAEFGSGSLALFPGASYTWRVQYHGAFASVDEMAGEEGFLSPFSEVFEAALGPRDGLGAYAVSNSLAFTVAQ